MAPTFLAAVVALLAPWVAKFGVNSDMLTTTITTLSLIAFPLFVMFRQWWTNRSTLLGKRPEDFRG